MCLFEVINKSSNVGLCRLLVYISFLICVRSLRLMIPASAELETGEESIEMYNMARGERALQKSWFCMSETRIVGNFTILN